MAAAISNLNSSWLMTGAKQSFFVQLCVSKLLNTTVLYLALIGLPFSSVLITAKACVGNALPVYFRNS